MIKKITAALALFWVAIIITLVNVVPYNLSKLPEPNYLVIGWCVTACIFIDTAAIFIALAIHADAYDTPDYDD